MNIKEWKEERVRALSLCQRFMRAELSAISKKSETAKALVEILKNDLNVIGISDVQARVLVASRVADQYLGKA